jgi:beta-N-acetylhexosaminidase
VLGRWTAVAAVAVGAAAIAATASATAPPGPWPAGEVVMGTLTAPPTPAFLARVRHGLMGGVLLLGDWTSAAAVSQTTSALQRAACARGEPLLVAVDQEGGLVRRLKWVQPVLAPAQIVSAPEAISQAAAAAAGMRAVGVDVDLAPVADTPSSAKSFLGTRAFSHSPNRNAILARAFVSGLQHSGVAATAKHFPGLGEADANTDLQAVTIHAAAWKLRDGLLPFERAIAAGVKLVMVSSAAYPALDPSGLPALLSPALMTDLLRGKLGFKGVTITDALDAPAAAAVPDAAAKSVLAGADLLVFGGEGASEQAYATLAADAKTEPELRARLAEAGTRIRALKAWLTAKHGPSCP